MNYAKQQNKMDGVRAMKDGRVFNDINVKEKITNKIPLTFKRYQCHFKILKEDTQKHNEMAVCKLPSITTFIILVSGI